MSTESSNILLVDKPSGITSFDVIRKLRRKLGVRKMGHAGTLDPMATGLMIVGVGDGTKELSKIIGLPKKYIAEVQFGIRTTTGDAEGSIVEQKAVPTLSPDSVSAALKSMEGDIELAVPIYSAIKRNGKPLYAYAREGKEIDAPIKTMHVLETKLEEVRGSIAKIIFNVKSGTYIRSLAEELGRRLGTVAALKSLRRISIGDFSVESADKIEA